MTKKKVFAVLCALLVSVSFAFPTYASTPDFKLADNGIIQPRFTYATDVSLKLTINGTTAKATTGYNTNQSGVTVSVRVTIEEKAPGGSWKQVASSSGMTTSCTTKSGYQYRAKATFTLTKNGQSEIINVTDGPYTA